MNLPLRLATSFNLVCALHAAADGSEVESNRGLHGCLVTIWERFFLLSGRHSPRWEYPRENSGRQSVAENPFAQAGDQMACNDHCTVLKRFLRRSLLVGDARSGNGQSRPSPDAGEWRGDGRAEWNGVRTYVLYKSQGDASRRPRWGPAFAPSMRLGSSPFSGVESTPLPTTRAKERREFLPANLEHPPAVVCCHVTLRCGPGVGVEGASSSSQRECTTGH